MNSVVPAVEHAIAFLPLSEVLAASVRATAETMPAAIELPTIPRLREDDRAIMLRLLRDADPTLRRKAMMAAGVWPSKLGDQLHRWAFGAARRAFLRHDDPDAATVATYLVDAYARVVPRHEPYPGEVGHIAHALEKVLSDDAAGAFWGFAKRIDRIAAAMWSGTYASAQGAA